MWTENPETYESSFYKRTLDNEIYIFTAPTFNGKLFCFFSFSASLCTCAHTSVREALQCGLAPVLSCWTSSQHYWQWSHSQASDITLFILLHFPLCLSTAAPSPPVSPPLPSAYPPPSVRFLLSALISLADIRTGKRQWNVARLDWINTCVECTLLNINYKGLKMSGIHLRR